MHVPINGGCVNQKAWMPGNIVCDDVDEYYEPIDKEQRKLVARLDLELRLIMHRAKIDCSKQKASPAVVKKPLTRIITVTVPVARDL